MTGKKRDGSMNPGDLLVLTVDDSWVYLDNDFNSEVENLDMGSVLVVLEEPALAPAPGPNFDRMWLMVKVLTKRGIRHMQHAALVTDKDNRAWITCERF